MSYYVVKLNIILIFLCSSNTSYGARTRTNRRSNRRSSISSINYVLKDLISNGYDMLRRSNVNVFNDNTAANRRVNVLMEDNAPDNNQFGYGDEWVYALHDEDGTAEFLDLTTGLKAKPEEVLTNHTMDSVVLGLFTRKNPNSAEYLTVDPYFDIPSLRSSNFNPKKRLKVLTHGWTPLGLGITLLQNITSNYLEIGDFNVIMVSWLDVSSKDYRTPSIVFPYVAKRISFMLRGLINSYNYKQDIHLIGHGVGAHVMGYAAKLSKKNIHRITGLDPERPFFEQPRNNIHYLRKGDARFVDIIHTSKGLRGYKNSYGDVDFYPNSGTAPQNGCKGFPVMREACSHYRSLFYFGESIITKTHFYAYPCKDFVQGSCDKNHALMGEHASHNIKGDYYLDTNSREPFAMGKHIYLSEEPTINVSVADANPTIKCNKTEEEAEVTEEATQWQPTQCPDESASTTITKTTISEDLTASETTAVSKITSTSERTITSTSTTTKKSTSKFLKGTTVKVTFEDLSRDGKDPPSYETTFNTPRPTIRKRPKQIKTSREKQKK